MNIQGHYIMLGQQVVPFEEYSITICIHVDDILNQYKKKKTEFVYIYTK